MRKLVLKINKYLLTMLIRITKLVTINWIILLVSCQLVFGQNNKENLQLRKKYQVNTRLNKANGLTIRKNLEKLLTNPTVIKYLATIKKAEGGEANLMVGGCRVKNLKKHPAEVLPKSCWFVIYIKGKKSYASSSGLYQITCQNWSSISKFLKLKTFSKKNQALAALELIRRGGGAANAKTTKGLRIKKQIQSGFLALASSKGFSKIKLKQAFRYATYDYASSKDSPLPVPANFKKIDYWLLSKKK